MQWEHWVSTDCSLWSFWYSKLIICGSDEAILDVNLDDAIGKYITMI